MSKTRVGKYAIESLTRSMYEDSRCIFREYVQNSADQIDTARLEHLDENDYYDIQINIDADNRTISVEDSATGVALANTYTLRDIARSTKRRGKNKGFRGIGRLGGLGYCSELIFETSYKGEAHKTIMRWDAIKLNQIVDDEDDDRDAGEVIDECLVETHEVEDINAHYFKIYMKDVTDDKLLDVESISEYLSMVAPVEYPTGFSRFSHQIKQYMRENNLHLDTYNLFVNGDQIYKGYTTRIENRKEGDYSVTDIRFFDRKDNEGNVIYWGWYSISELKGQIQSYNIPYGMRLRCHNIQIGDESTCKRFFSAEGDKRFAQYFYGEVNVVTPELQPDGRRDYFREGAFRKQFEQLLTSDFLQLKVLCNEASDIRGSFKKVATAVAGQVSAARKKEKGFVSAAEKEKTEQDFAKYQQLKEKESKHLRQINEKMQNEGSPLSFMMNELNTCYFGGANFSPLSQGTQSPQLPPVIDNTNTSENTGTGLRTDSELYSNFGKKEKKVINKVYEVIFASIADEQIRERLISKIEAALTKK